MRLSQLVCAARQPQPIDQLRIELLQLAKRHANQNDFFSRCLQIAGKLGKSFSPAIVDAHISEARKLDWIDVNERGMMRLLPKGHQALKRLEQKLGSGDPWAN